MKKVVEENMFYAIKVVFKTAYSRTLPYRLEKTSQNFDKCEAIIAVLNSLFYELRYTHEIVEVTNGPETFKS